MGRLITAVLIIVVTILSAMGLSKVASTKSRSVEEAESMHKVCLEGVLYWKHTAYQRSAITPYIDAETKDYVLCSNY